MTSVLVTGSTAGVGLACAATLLDMGHDVVVHGRTPARLGAVAHLLERGAHGVVGDLAQPRGIADIVEQVNALGTLDAAIHNAGTMHDDAVLPVNVVAPYLLTAALARPARLIYLSSSMHRSGRADLTDIDWTSRRHTHSYADSKLYVTTLMAAVARLWPATLAHAVDPGWVPTAMGGPGATDDLSLAHLTQVWLATSSDAPAQITGGYWYHRKRHAPHPAVADRAFQDELLASLADHTGVALPSG